MCRHSTDTNDLIIALSNDLYPRVADQLQIALGMINQLPESNDNQSLGNVFLALRQEFTSLAAYEIRLVFPSVMKVFNQKKHMPTNGHPNIAELQALTKLKEQKLQALALQLSALLKDIKRVALRHSLENICVLVLSDFADLKLAWHNMINERMRTCACFIRFQSIEPLNTKPYVSAQDLALPH